MTLKQQMAADIAGVFLNTDEHADSITRYIQGSESNTESVDAVFDEKDSSRDEQRGEDNVRRACLYLDPDQETTVDDGWLIEGNRWETVSEGSDGGMKVVQIQRVDEQRRFPKSVRAI